MTGSHSPHAKCSLQSIKFLLRYGMGIMLGLISFALWAFSTKHMKWFFPKFESASMHTRPHGYLDLPHIYLEHVCHAYACATCMPDMTSLGLQIIQTTSS